MDAFGFKSKDWHFSDDYVARNVLTIIERISKQIGMDLMWYYEGLSEHAHPNYLGMMATYREPAEEGNPVVRFADSPNESRNASIIIAIGGLFIALDMLRLGIEQHAELKGRFAAMCGWAIHKGGTCGLPGQPLSRQSLAYRSLSPHPARCTNGRWREKPAANAPADPKVATKSPASASNPRQHQVPHFRLRLGCVALQRSATVCNLNRSNRSIF